MKKRIIIDIFKIITILFIVISTIFVDYNNFVTLYIILRVISSTTCIICGLLLFYIVKDLIHNMKSYKEKRRI